MSFSRNAFTTTCKRETFAKTVNNRICQIQRCLFSSVSRSLLRLRADKRVQMSGLVCHSVECCRAGADVTLWAMLIILINIQELNQLEQQRALWLAGMKHWQLAWLSKMKERRPSFKTMRRGDSVPCADSTVRSEELLNAKILKG